MIAKKMQSMVANSSAIRAMFEEGNRLAEIYGRENVFDFSLGNPNVPAPAGLNTAIKEILDEETSTFVHGYMNNAGYEDVRETIAASLNRRFETSFTKDNIIMTVGAAGGLNVILKTLLNPGDEVIAFAPYFLEYRSYINNYDGVLVEVSPDTETFMPNLAEFEEKITAKTKAVLINNPNNPIVVAVEPYGKGKYWNVKLESNVTVSGYGKDGFGNYLATAKNEGRILYAYKKYSQQNKNGPGVYFSDSILSADYSNNLARFKEIVNKKFLEKHPIGKGWTVNQPGELYSERDTDSVSTRSLLANALEGTAQNEIEKNKLAQYKEKIELIEAEQKKLHELREKMFTKGIKGDERRKIQDEATRTANRINTYDRQLFNLESTTALKNVLTREKEIARKRQKQRDVENLKAYKEKRDAEVDYLIKKNKKAIENRHKTVLKHKIGDVLGV